MSQSRLSPSFRSHLTIKYNTRFWSMVIVTAEPHRHLEFATMQRPAASCATSKVQVLNHSMLRIPWKWIGASIQDMKVRLDSLVGSTADSQWTNTNIGRHLPASDRPAHPAFSLLPLAWISPLPSLSRHWHPFVIP